jgi:hypothetical protein
MDPTKPDCTRARGTRLVALISVMFLVTFFACGDPYLHNNPYDPATSVEFSISGPDSLFSLQQVGQYIAQISPVMPDTAVQWYSTNTGVLTPAGSGGAFVEQYGAPVWPATATVRVYAGVGAIDSLGGGGRLAVPVTVYRHLAFKDVVVTQRDTNTPFR